MILKYSIYLLLLFVTLPVMAQEPTELEDETYYTFYGRIFVENDKGSGVTVHLYDDNKLISTFKTNKKAKFTVGTPSSKHYTLEFKKKGFVTKRVIINTSKVYLAKGKVQDFDFNVYLIKEEVGVDYSILDFPMALIEYRKNIKGFDYNKRYTKQMHKLQNDVVANGFATVLVD